ncbi:MAG TPA: MFS transporter [Spirochaetota bacterium]|nr:MFS transporter [Spirochaetota bacterium]
MIRSTKALTVSSFLSMFFIGVGSTVIGAAARNIGLTPSQIGLLLAVQNVGFGLSVSTSGALSDSYQKPKILLVGAIVLSIAFALFYRWPSFVTNLIIMFFIGIGMGGFEGVTDAMLLDIHEEKESLFINVNHFFVTFGSLMIALYLLFLQMNWQKSMAQSSIAVACIAILFALSRLENRRGASEKMLDRIRSLKGERSVFILFIATACIVGCELGTQGIMTTFLMELRGFSQVTSKLGLIIFLSGVAIGRLLVGLFTKRHHLSGSILVLLALCTVLFSTLFFIDTNSKLGLTFTLIFLNGLTLSAVFPLILSLAGIMYKQMAGTVLGIIKMGIPFGGIFIPIILAMISRYYSFRLSLLVFPFFSFVSFIILLTNRNKFRSFNL